jgi:tripartite-type tricarboxylate transporter receptor subunit TctC
MSFAFQAIRRVRTAHVLRTYPRARCTPYGSVAPRWTAWLLALIAGIAGAQQDYPSRPIRIVVAYPPGGSNDFLARLFSPRLSEILGKQVVIDNRGGGNTIIGTDLVAKAAPDGYTLLLGGSTMVSMPHLYRHLPFDPIKDFTPIRGIARSEFMLVVHPALPVHTVRDLIDLARKKPGELNYATSSTGGPTHLGPVQFEMLAGVKMQQVPYKGGGPAMADLVGGQVQLAFANPAGAIPMIKAGRLRAIAISGDTRLEALPQVPTFAESGLSGLVLRNWYAVAAPDGPPKGVVERLSDALQKTAAMPEVKSAISKQGLWSFSATSAEMDAIRREDLALVGKVIRTGNIKIQQ